MNENIFRAYDVRGNSSHDLTDDVVRGKSESYQDWLTRV